MKTVEKLKLDKKTYKELKKMLTSSDEDFEIACSNIKNIEMTSIAITLLAKHLVYGRRNAFMKQFEKSVFLILDIKKDNPVDLSWEHLFKCFSTSPYLTDLEFYMFFHTIHSNLASPI